MSRNAFPQLEREYNEQQEQREMAAEQRSVRYWQDLACANRKVAEEAQAQRDKAVAIAYKDGLERAATLCDEYAEVKVAGAMVCAAAIRAMKVEK